MPPPEPTSTELAALVQQVCANPKYASISVELISAIGKRELLARRNLKEAVKATRNKLHQVAGAYQSDRPAYAQWLAELTQAAAPSTNAPQSSSINLQSAIYNLQSFQAACRQIMAHHASTRERLPFLAQFYATVFAALPPVQTVLDVACGLNPLALPWMPLAPGATYLACDIYHDMASFLGSYLTLAGISGQAFVCDLVAGAPPHRADLALALKVLPPLEQLAAGAGVRLLRTLNTRYILVSFPAQSLGGHDKRMVANYDARFNELLTNQGWQAKRFLFPTELAFLVDKG